MRQRDQLFTEFLSRQRSILTSKGYEILSVHTQELNQLLGSGFLDQTSDRKRQLSAYLLDSKERLFRRDAKALQ